MIKARAGDLIIFGLSEENIRRLKKGMPIMIKGAEVGLPELKFGIMYGETEKAMVEELANAGWMPPERH